jgi:ribosomal protein S18 acetylase RimI-like enzyme
MGDAPAKLKPAVTAVRAELVWGLMEERDAPRAAEIYIRSFPERVQDRFRDRERARCFYQDLLEGMRLRYPESCFAARTKEGVLVAYLMLTHSGRGHLRSLAPGWFFRCLINGLRGRYGLPLRFLGSVLRPAQSSAPKPLRELCRRSPHVPVVAVDDGYLGMGVGSRLLEQARAFALRKHRSIWLLVDERNRAAIRLYERLGFQIIGRDGAQYRMLWEL